MDVSQNIIGGQTRNEINRLRVRLLPRTSLCKLLLNPMEPTFVRFLHAYSVPSAGAELAHLRLLAKAFSSLPYENVTKILKEAKTAGSMQKLRDPSEVLEDHLRWRTGGTCFSLCNTLNELLTQSGYCSFIAMADMHYGRNIHCAVIVEIESQRYLLDPGYLLAEPILLPLEGQKSMIQTAMNAIYLKCESHYDFSLYTEERSELKWRYRLRAIPVAREEFLQHWIRSFSLNSMENLLLSRLDEAGRIYFRKNRLDLVGKSGREKRLIGADEVHQLSSIFGVPSDLIQQAHSALLARPK